MTDKREVFQVNGSHRVWSMRKSALKRSQWVDGNLEFRIDDRGSIPFDYK
jgi:hypothetical protein